MKKENVPILSEEDTQFLHVSNPKESRWIQMHKVLQEKETFNAAAREFDLAPGNFAWNLFAAVKLIKARKHVKLCRQTGVLITRIEFLEDHVPKRVLHVTLNSGIETVFELCQRKTAELRKFRDFGKKTVVAWEEFFVCHELSFGMHFEPWYLAQLKQMSDTLYILGK